MSRPQLPPPSLRRGRERSRARSRKRPLTVDRILDAAFVVMARDGYAAVTMRRLATELGTGPASLYAHIDGKADLDALVLDRVAAEIDVPMPDADRWQQQLMQMMRDTLAAMRRHPGVANAAVAYIPTGPEAMRVSEGMLAILRAGGLSDQVSAYAADLLTLYVTAHAVEGQDWEQVHPDDDGAESEPDFIIRLREYFQSLPEETFPNTRALAVALTSGAAQERFEFGMHVLLAGIAAVP